MKKHWFLLLSACVCLASCEKPRTDKPRPNAQNSVMENESDADREITDKIYQGIKNDDSLSPDAANITVVTKNGIVTLSGPVNSDREKYAIGLKVKTISGVRNVDNQLEVTRK